MRWPRDSVLQWVLLGVALFGGLRLWQVLHRDGLPAQRSQPTAAQLQTWFAQHRDRYDRPVRVDWQLATPAGSADEATARQLAQQLTASKAVGLEVVLQIKRGEPVAQLAQQWGAEFASQLQRLEPASWTALAAREGWQVVRLNALLPAHSATFEEVEPAVRSDWLDAAVTGQGPVIRQPQR